MEFMIGGLAGAGATILTNPMDLVKTRLQLQGELKAKSDHTLRYRGIFHAIYVIARTDGALALQKGLSAAVLQGFTINSVRLGIYHIAERQGWMKNEKGEISISKAVFWSSASGYVSAVFGNPVSVVKTRIQATSHPSIAVGRQHKYDGVLHRFTTIYKTEGMRGFFTGVNAICVRIAVGSGAQLTTFSVVKEWLVTHGGFENQSQVTVAFVASLVSGVVVVGIEGPFDLVNTRLYNQGPTAKNGLLYTGILDCMRKTYHAEGIKGLYKGAWPLYLRIAPNTTVSLILWDLLNTVLLKDK